MPTFLVLPDADVTAGVPTTLANAIIDADTTLGGLTNGTAYRAFVLSGQSDAFTPAAAPSSAVTRQTTIVVDEIGANAQQSWTRQAGFTASAGDLIVISGTFRRQSGTGTAVSSMTIAGQAMTLVREVVSSNSVFIFRATLAANLAATDNIVVDVGAGNATNLLVLHPVRLVGFNATPHASNGTSTTATSASTTVNVPAGGVLIANFNLTGGNEAATLAGVVEDYDSDFTNSTNFRSFHGLQSGLSVETGRVVSQTGTISQSRRVVAASFAPL